MEPLVTCPRKTSAPRCWNRDSATVHRLGLHVSRYGLAIVMLWIGGMKFTAYEAQGIEALVSESPLLGWTYGIMQAAVLGLFEIAAGLMIAARPWLPRLSAVGSAAMVPMFLLALSFIVTTPGWEPSLGSPALSAMPGQFLLKDLPLLGVAVLTAAEAYSAASHGGSDS